MLKKLDFSDHDLVTFHPKDTHDVQSLYNKRSKIPDMKKDGDVSKTPAYMVNSRISGADIKKFSEKQMHRYYLSLQRHVDSHMGGESSWYYVPCNTSSNEVIPINWSHSYIDHESGCVCEDDMNGHTERLVTDYRYETRNIGDLADIVNDLLNYDLRYQQYDGKQREA
jgi:hypothetical protein